MKTYLNIRQERISREWTQEYVGEKVGVTKTHIHDIETGKQKPSYDVLVRLENLFNKSHRYLLEQVVETNTQADYSASVACGLDEAKELNSATQDFDVSVEMIVDIAEDGRLDSPEYREQAERLNAALTAALN